jgi:hypothetical protein
MEWWEHYIYMVLFLIVNNELRHFGTCNDDLLFPSNNQIFFYALHCYVPKKSILFEDKLVLSWIMISFTSICLLFVFLAKKMLCVYVYASQFYLPYVSLVYFPLFSHCFSHNYILFKIDFAFVYICSAPLISLTWILFVLTYYSFGLHFIVVCCAVLACALPLPLSFTS